MQDEQKQRVGESLPGSSRYIQSEKQSKYRLYEQDIRHVDICDGGENKRFLSTLTSAIRRKSLGAVFSVKDKSDGAMQHQQLMDKQIQAIKEAISMDRVPISSLLLFENEIRARQAVAPDEIGFFTPKEMKAQAYAVYDLMAQARKRIEAFYGQAIKRGVDLNSDYWTQTAAYAFDRKKDNMQSSEEATYNLEKLLAMCDESIESTYGPQYDERSNDTMGASPFYA